MCCVAAPPVARALVRAPSEECNGSGVHGSGWRLCRGGSGGGGQRPWLRAIDQDLHCEVSPSASGENVQVLQIVADEMRARARVHTHTHTHTKPPIRYPPKYAHKHTKAQTHARPPTHPHTYSPTYSPTHTRLLARSLVLLLGRAHTHTRTHAHTPLQSREPAGLSSGHSHSSQWRDSPLRTVTMPSR